MRHPTTAARETLILKTQVCSYTDYGTEMV
jgi:hypothetical protein